MIITDLNDKKENISSTGEAEGKTAEEFKYGVGIDEEFTTDGQLHEEKFLNKEYMYTNTADSFKIGKDGDGYFIIDYIDESIILEEEVPVKVEKSRLKLENDIYLVNKDELVYAYDTKLENVVFLNKENDYRIIFEADKIEE